MTCACRICSDVSAIESARSAATAASAAAMGQSISMVVPGTATAGATLLAGGGRYFDQACFGGHTSKDTNPATRESHVPDEMFTLRVTVNTLVEEVDALCARLANVTSPLPGQTKGDDSPDTYRVPLANEIRSERRRVQGVIDLVRQLSMHLEL